MKKIILILIMLFIYACITSQKTDNKGVLLQRDTGDSNSFSSDNENPLLSLSLDRNFNFETQENLEVVIRNEKPSHIIVRELDPLKMNPRVIARLNIIDDLRLDLICSKGIKEIMLIVSDDEGTRYFRQKVYQKHVSFDLN